VSAAEVEPVEEEIEDEEEEEEEKEDFSGLNKAELRELAEERGLDVPKKASKDQLLAALEGRVLVGELLPIIRQGDWVRLAVHDAVPNHLANRDAVVLRALVKRAEGGDVISPQPYEFQDGSEVFQVRVRDTADVLELTRESFRSHGTQQVELGVA